MALRRPITERQAAALVVLDTIRETSASWGRLVNHLKRYDQERELPFHRKYDVREAQLHLNIAAVACGLLAVQNLFPPEQATRLHAATVEALASQALPGGTRSSAYSPLEGLIDAYHGRWRDSLRMATQASGNPNAQLPPAQWLDNCSLLLEAWGVNVERVDMGDMVVYLSSPLLGTALNSLLTPYAGAWKALLERYDILP